MNKKAMYHLTYGLFVLTSCCDGKDSGCIINTAGQVTSEPNRISIAVNKANFTLGSHTLFIAAVKDMDVLSHTPSADYGYYQSHIKPKPQEPKETGKTIWRCKVCGYTYEGEELPADYICPLCKHPASDFEKVVL